MRNIIIVLLVILCCIGSACSSSSKAPTSRTPVPTTPAAKPPATTPAGGSVPSQMPQSAAPALVTEVVYFTTNQRCPECLCFESRIKFVIDTRYKQEISDGRLIFKILNVQKQDNEEIVKKYKAMGTQLFVNTIINGVDHIQDIQQIWGWNCDKDPNGFMDKVSDVLDKSLKGY